VGCGGVRDTLRLLGSETVVSLRIFSDATFVEAYFQNGRVAITEVAALHEASSIALTSSATTKVRSAVAYPMESIWTTPQAVREQPRVYP